MGRPAVSVIIPTFNRVGFLREALDSVHAQTVQDFELIVVDDGSTDDLEAAIARHASRPRIVHQAHQGPAAARNRGLEEARADIVAFLDSDDLWHPMKLESFMAAIESRRDINIFYGPMRPVDEHQKPVPGRTKPCHDGWITQELFCSSFVHVPTVVCRRDVLLRADGFNPDLPVCEDYDLWLRLSVRERFGLVDEPMALRRLHGDRLSKRCMGRNLAVKARVLQQFFESKSANGKLDPHVARSRLAKVLYAAGRAAYREGRYQESVRLCRDGRRYGGSLVRSLPMLLMGGARNYLSDRPAAAPEGLPIGSANPFSGE